MKILHLASQDNGGAGRAALRLHQALLEQGIDSQMIVQHKTTDLPTIHTLTQSRYQKLLIPFRQAFDQLPTLFYKNKKKDIFSSTFVPSNKLLLKRIKEFNPDIIHLHWINSGFINIFDLFKFEKPILWSLHDANTFTGGCHVVDKGCEKYKSFCHSCSLLNSKFKYDISYLNFKRKQRAYKNLDFTVNGLSHWIASEAKSSTLLKDKTIINLPNTIDTTIFHPVDKNIAREILGIKSQKFILGFGAISSTQVERKGYLQLKKALELLPHKDCYMLIVFGSSYGKEIAGIETIFLGHIHDDTTLKLMYSVFDATIMPSLSESFGQVALESLACGTPVVCFNTTGLKDIVTHKYNGFLAQNFSSQELSQGIQWIFSLQQKQKKQLRSNAIQTAKKFSYPLISRQYIQQYTNILQNTTIST